MVSFDVDVIVGFAPELDVVALGGSVVVASSIEVDEMLGSVVTAIAVFVTEVGPFDIVEANAVVLGSVNVEDLFVDVVAAVVVFCEATTFKEATKVKKLRKNIEKKFTIFYKY